MSATCHRSRSSTRARPFAMWWKKPSARSRTPRRAWIRCTPPTPSRTPISMPWLPSRPSWRPSCRRPTVTTWSASWKSPPMPCACRRGTPRSSTSPAERSVAWRCVVCCCRLPTCCCWTNRPTTWTPTRSPGWSGSSMTSRAPWWPSPTTATSSTMSPAGFSSSTAAPASRTRVTTPAGWKPSPSVWPRSPSSSRPTKKP